MKNDPAIALLEFREIAVGLFTTDSVVKKAPIAALKSGTISQGRFLILIGGTTASVQESYEEGLQAGGDSVIDHVFLPDVHPLVYQGILGDRQASGWHGAIGILETHTICGNVRAAEKALKTTDVNLVELRLSDSWLAGKGISIYHGELYDVQAAVEEAAALLEAQGQDVIQRIITQPHEAVTRQLETSTHFETNPFLDLDGEKVRT